MPRVSRRPLRLAPAAVPGADPRPPVPAPGRSAWRRVALSVLLLGAVCNLTGCSLFIMAGKMLFGDPLRECAFKTGTGIDLTKAKKKVLVHCSVAHHIQARHETIDYDLVERVTRHMEKQGIPVVNCNEVKSWMDRNGDRMTHPPTKLATDFQTDYIIDIELKQFTQHEENSPSLYRGTLTGLVSVWEVDSENGQKRVWQKWAAEFTSIYPEFSPLSQHQVSSPEIFVRTCIERAATDVAHMLYDHHASEEVH